MGATMFKPCIASIVSLLGVYFPPACARAPVIADSNTGNPELGIAEFRVAEAKDQFDLEGSTPEDT
jgi:hypothetical protein